MSAVRTDQTFGFDPGTAVLPPSARRRIATSTGEAALRLAGQVQQSLLGAAVSSNTRLAFHTVHLPADHVSGDIYTFRETDDRRVTLAIADVTGHGVAAAMMATYVLRALSEAAAGDAGRSPTERLQALNDEMFAAACPNAPFAAALSATYDLTLHRLEWARGGVPYPILVRPGQPAVQLRSAGCILGAFDRVTLQRRYQPLHPGESVIFHTDGLDAILLHEGGARVFDCISQTPWFASLGDRSIGESLAAVEQRRHQGGDHGWPVDDVTLLAITRRA